MPMEKISKPCPICRKRYLNVKIHIEMFHKGKKKGNEKWKSLKKKLKEFGQ